MKLYAWERWTLGLILAGVGMLAAYVSIFHVATWTMENSPPGTSIVSGLTNAAISELIPVAALIVYRICRRNNRSTKLAVFLIIAAGSLSLSAQFAVAKVGVSGWVVSAVPMLAFMALTKLVISLLSPAVERQGEQTANERQVNVGVTPEPRSADSPGAPRSPTPAARKKAPAGPRSGSKPTRRPLPPSLTTAGKIAAAVTKVGADATPAQLAAEAGVSVSTVGRHLPRAREASAREVVRSSVAAALAS